VGTEARSGEGRAKLHPPGRSQVHTLVRHGVDSIATPWPTPDYPPDSQRPTFPDSVPDEGFCRKGRTGGGEAAGGRSSCPRQLVKADPGKDHPGCRARSERVTGVGDHPRQCSTMSLRSSPTRSAKARSERSRVAPTRYAPGSSSSDRELLAALSRRRVRFRSTAPPTLLPTE